MAQETFLDKVRDWLGGLAFNIFLWSIRMTQDQYLDAIIAESKLRSSELDEPIQ